jgi:uncharacterized membrane protein
MGAWTEPLTLGLFIGAFAFWRRKAWIAGVLFGLALVSKQYLVFLLPLVLLHREERYWSRVGVGALAGIATFLPFLVLDANALFQALILNLTEISFRPDTLSLSGMLNEYGITFEIPRAVWLVLIGLTGIAAGVKSRTRRDLALLSGVVLAVAFVTGLAFLNYWFLVFGLVAISVSGLLGGGSESGGHSRTAPAAV